MILGGRYLPVSVLGKGGFGTAFLARDIDSPTKRKCVVKLFQPPVTLTPAQMATAQRLFATEAEVLERFGLQHPQIPNLYAYFPLLITNPLTNQSEELFYLVQEFVDGEDLEQILDREGAFSEQAVANVLKEMLKVLDFVHSNGAIHRDVKPSNIMKGRNGKLYLLDFGAVKEVATPSGVQRGPTTICSPDYAPPEQIMNGTVGATSDLYALAASCVMLLTCKSSQDLRDSSTNSWNWHTYAQVSDSIRAVLDKMLQARPDERFPSAKAVLAALMPQPSPPLINQQRGSQQNQGQQNRGGQNQGQQSQGQQSQGQQNQGQNQNLIKQRNQGQPPNLAQRKSSAPLPLIQFLSRAAFTGTEGGLLAIAISSLIGTISIGSAVWLFLIAALLFLQLKRTIEGWDFIIIVGITAAAVVLIPPLSSAIGGQAALVAFYSVMAGGAVVLVATLFRIIFQILTHIM